MEVAKGAGCEAVCSHEFGLKEAAHSFLHCLHVIVKPVTSEAEICLKTWLGEALSSMTSWATNVLNAFCAICCELATGQRKLCGEGSRGGQGFSNFHTAGVAFS